MNNLENLSCISSPPTRDAEVKQSGSPSRISSNSILLTWPCNNGTPPQVDAWRSVLMLEYHFGENDSYDLGTRNVA